MTLIKRIEGIKSVFIRNIRIIRVPILLHILEGICLKQKQENCIEKNDRPSQQLKEPNLTIYC